MLLQVNKNLSLRIGLYRTLLIINKKNGEHLNNGDYNENSKQWLRGVELNEVLCDF